MKDVRCRSATREDFRFLATMLGEVAVWRPDKPSPTADEVLAPRHEPLRAEARIVVDRGPTHSSLDLNGYLGEAGEVASILVGMATTFTRMDESTQEQWAVIGRETYAHQGRVADRMLDMLRSLADITDGFAVDQLTHSLQTATRAERAGADEEVVFASLLHDVGKAVSVPNHPEIAAAIIKPYVRDEVYQMIRAHQDFQGRHYYHHFGGDPNARDRYEGEPWFDLAAQFADDWDQTAFDPDYDTLPLEHFEPLVRARTASPRF